MEGRLTSFPIKPLHPWDLSGKKSSWEVYPAVKGCLTDLGFSHSGNLPKGRKVNAARWKPSSKQEGLPGGNLPSTRKVCTPHLWAAPYWYTLLKWLGVGPGQKRSLMDPSPFILLLLDPSDIYFYRFLREVGWKGWNSSSLFMDQQVKGLQRVSN